MGVGFFKVEEERSDRGDRGGDYYNVVFNREPDDEANNVVLRQTSVNLSPFKMVEEGSPYV